MIGVVKTVYYGLLKFLKKEMFRLRPQPSKPKKKEEIHCIVTTQFENFIVTAEGIHMAYTLANDHYVNVQVAYVDSKGNPAQVDGDVVWASSNDAIVTVAVLTESVDTTKAQIKPGVEIGQAQITATADARIGPDIKEIICTLDVMVVGGEAVSGTITPTGDPLPIP